MGNVTVVFGGNLVPPPLSIDQVKRYCGDVKGFPEINELMNISQNGAPAKSTCTNLYPINVL